MDESLKRIKRYYDAYEKEVNSVGEDWDGMLDISVLSQLADSIPYLLECIEKLQEKLNAKIMFVSNGMEDEHCALQEEVIQLQKENSMLKKWINRKNEPLTNEESDIISCWIKNNI